jgi:DNA polymerase-3 subunit delta
LPENFAGAVVRVLAQDLPQHLKRGLANCYFVFGEEPLQHAESIDAIRLAAKQQGYAEREIFQLTSNFEWAALFSSVDTPSLFAEKRLIECCINDGKIGKGIADTLAKLATLSNSTSLIFLFSASKLDSKIQQCKGFSALEQRGITVCARFFSPKETYQWIEKRLAAAGFQTTPLVTQELLARTEGNLLATSQVIAKLQLCVDPQKMPVLSIEDIRTIIDTDTRFTIYDLVDASLSASVERTSRIFLSLKSEGIDPILVLWAITREVRTIIAIFCKIKDGQISNTLLSEQGVWKNREPLIKTFINRFSLSSLQKILLQSKKIDDIVKGRLQGSAWDSLFSICLTLTGAYHE